SDRPAEPVAKHAVAHLIVVLPKHDETFGRNVARRATMATAAKARILSGIGKSVAVGSNKLVETAVVLVIAAKLTGEKSAKAVMEVIVPLRVKAVTTLLARANQAGIVIGAFSDQKHLPFEPLRGAMNLAAEIFEKSYRCMIEYCVHGIYAQRVDVKLSKPIQGVLNEVIPYFVAERAVEIQRRSPGGFIALG